MTKRKRRPGAGTDRKQRPARRNGGDRHGAAANRPAGAPKTAQTGGIWLYGSHAVRAALANPRRRASRLLVTAAAHAEFAAAAKPSAEIVDRAEIEALLAPGSVHQGVALYAAPLAEISVEEIAARVAETASACVLVLDQVSDPRNVGAAMRAAAAFGAIGIIVTARRGAEATPALAKAASGAIEILPLVRAVNLAHALDRLKAAGMWCVGLDESAGQPLADIDLGGRIALVLGAEGAGLRRLTRERCDILARLPTRPPITSLNVAAAAACALYECTRRTAP